MFRLRPHHLLCIQHYTGHGYDEEFSAHMNQVTDSLRRDPKQHIQIKAGCDELCSVCPNRVEGSCNTTDKVDKMDAAVKEICTIQTDEISSWEKFRDLAKAKIIDAGLFDNVCGDCQWFELCQSVRDNK